MERPRRASPRTTSLPRLGAGWLVMLGDNDAGGLLAYAATGAQFGARFFLPLLVPLVLLTLLVQDTSMRLGLVSGQSLPGLLARKLGPSWARLLAADLALQNFFLLLTECSGMALGLDALGVPTATGVVLSVLAVLALLWYEPTRGGTRLLALAAAGNLLLVPLAWWAHPPLAWQDVLVPPGGPRLPLYVLAAVGNALAPWMVVFEAHAVRGGTPDCPPLSAARLDLSLGAAAQLGVAASTMVLGAAVPRPDILLHPLAWMDTLGTQLGPLARDVFALSLVDAGLVAAATVSLSTAWTVVESFSAARGHGTPARSRVFAVHAASIVAAGAAVLLGHLPVTLLAVAAQAAAAVLLPPTLVILLLLSSDPAILPAPRRPRTWQRLALAAFTGACTLSCLLLLDPGWARHSPSHRR